MIKRIEQSNTLCSLILILYRGNTAIATYTLLCTLILFVKSQKIQTVFDSGLVQWCLSMLHNYTFSWIQTASCLPGITLLPFVVIKLLQSLPIAESAIISHWCTISIPTTRILEWKLCNLFHVENSLLTDADTCNSTILTELPTGWLSTLYWIKFSLTELCTSWI